MIQADKGRISTIVISTALGLGGRGIFPYTLLPSYRQLLRRVRETGTAVFAKSATPKKRTGNFIALNPFTWKYIRRLPDQGMLNAYGLTNPGAAVCAREIKKAVDQGFRVIPNLYPEFAKGADTAIGETLEAIGVLQQALGPDFWALELNFSCPNSAEAIAANVVQSLRCCREVQEKNPGLFLIAKISIRHPYEFARELENLGIDAIHAVNTVPYEIIYPQGRSPLKDVGGGGVSGGPAFTAALNYNAGLRRQVKLPLIMGCGVRNREDVQKYLDAGADAVSFCTLALRNPGEAAEIVAGFNR
jgi:dihydroorotate dehydrogenase (NAD+) catalytic subunit